MSRSSSSMSACKAARTRDGASWGIISSSTASTPSKRRWTSWPGRSKARQQDVSPWLAIGDEDGERKFFYKPSKSHQQLVLRGVRLATCKSRTVPVRKLDTLLREGIIPRADFLKVDVEGFEKDVFRGASDLLGAGVLGIECETNFRTSIVYPESHFGLIHGTVLHYGLVLFDLNCNRIPRAAYQQARHRRNLPALPPEGSGMPATFNVLFCGSLQPSATTACTTVECRRRRRSIRS